MTANPTAALEQDVARLTEELTSSYEQLALLHTLTDRLRPFVDAEHVVRTVLDTVASAVRVRHAFMLLSEDADPRERSERLLWVATGDGAGERLLTGAERHEPVRDGITREAIQTGRPIIVNDVRSDPRFVPYPVRISSLLTVPLRGRGAAGDGVLGVLSLADRLDGQGFTSGDLKLVVTLAGLAGAALDNARLVGDLQRANGEVREANRKILEQQNAMIRAEKLSSLGRMAEGVAHELRNPLAVVGGRAQLLLMQLRNGRIPAPEALERALDAIETQAARANRIIGGLSTYARQRPPEIGPVEVAQVATEALDLARIQMKASTVEVTVDFAPGLPPIRGNRDHVQQVFINLIINALQAMGGAGRLALRAEPYPPGSITITVSDTGAGIPAEHLPRIFDPFFTTKAEGEGTGLGLSIIHGIVETHGGTISVASEVGNGTTVTLRFPALDQHRP